MQVDLEKLKTLLAKGEKIPRIFLIEDDDGYVFTTALKAIRLHLFKSDDRQVTASHEFHYSAKGLGVKAVNDIDNALKTVSLFAAERLIVLREGESLRSQDEQNLLKCIDDPRNFESSTLILHYGKVRANAKLKKEVEKRGLFVKQATDRKPQFEASVRAMAQEKGLRLNNDAVRFIMEVMPRNLSLLERELEKLSLYAGGQGTVDAAQAAQLICSSNLKSIFELTDLIGTRQTKEAIKILFDMLDSGEPPQMLLAMIARQMRHLYRVKQLVGHRVSREIVTQALETKSNFVIDKATRQARGFSLEGLRQAMHDIAKVDVELKSTSTAPQILLERLVQRLCQLPDERSAARSAR